ncbi:two-component system, response regulator YesN [Cohnella sp. OV330]|uniref:response regulator n=1 Tax=Cohnella sp. OV330 TaxID=1855288 RepID=UPI0008E00381|nr:response regulator [Cohnella sp. OV330]SFB58071.1 two-component system, response regulator YesN [Cohnella sp. OV330]
MKVLLIEDEPLLRQGLVRIVERMGLPIEEIGEAADGREGLRRLAELRPDIVVTDIRMPEMNGLDFIREAKKLDEKLEFILVSGYEEFEFAKRGIQYGVADYLLKPVDPDELRGCLMRIMAKIEQDRRHSSLGEELRQLQQKSEETSRERLLTKLIQQGGESVAVEQDEKLAAMSVSCREFAVVLIEVALPGLPYRSFLQGDEALLRFAISNVISQMLESAEREGTLFRHSIYDKELVYVLGDGNSIEPAAMKRELEEALTGINRYLKLEATIGFGMPVRSVRQIHQSYQQAKQALRDRILHGRNQVYAMTPAPGGKGNERSVLAEEDERFVFRLLNDGGAEALTKWLGRRVEALVQYESSSFNQLESFCIDLHLLFRKYLLLQTSIPEWIIGEVDDMLNWLHAAEDWTEIAAKLTDMASNMIEHLHRMRHSSNPDLMDEIKLYIDANLHEPISLQTIADRFYIHPNYFSRRFKERFKGSFVSYMTDERIRKAEQLLKKTELQIQEIAVMVGFPDAAYFSSVFRKSTGTTPVQYRSKAER